MAILRDRQREITIAKNNFLTRINHLGYNSAPISSRSEELLWNLTVNLNYQLSFLLQDYQCKLQRVLIVASLLQ